jgi:hypothetical protein
VVFFLIISPNLPGRAGYKTSVILKYDSRVSSEIRNGYHLNAIIEYYPYTILLGKGMKWCDTRRHHHLSRIRPLGLFPFRTYFSENYESIWKIGRTPWTGDEPNARPIPTQRTTQHRKTLTHIRASSGIRTHDPCVRTAENSTCLRPLGHWDRPKHTLVMEVKELPGVAFLKLLLPIRICRKTCL